MASSIIAMALATGIWVFVEAWGRFYPAKVTWLRLRRARGRRAVRRMRERFEAAGRRRSARVLVFVLLAAVAVWVASAPALDKRWYEVLADAAPSLIVILALLRIHPALRAIAERMREYERETGEDPDQPLDDDTDLPPTDEIAL